MFFTFYEVIFLIQIKRSDENVRMKGVQMKKAINYSMLVVVFTLIWIILNEKAGPLQLLSGIGFSVVAIFFTNHYLLETDYPNEYFIKPRVVLRYSAYLIIQIYQSGFSAIAKIIKGEDAVKIIDYDTCITNELAICLLANAITLTPGTVTINKEGSHLQILSFEDETAFSTSSGGKACSSYEIILSRVGT